MALELLVQLVNGTKKPSNSCLFLFGFLLAHHRPGENTNLVNHNKFVDAQITTLRLSQPPPSRASRTQVGREPIPPLDIDAREYFLLRHAAHLAADDEYWTVALGQALPTHFEPSPLPLLSPPSHKRPPSPTLPHPPSPAPPPGSFRWSMIPHRGGEGEGHAAKRKPPLRPQKN